MDRGLVFEDFPLISDSISEQHKPRTPGQERQDPLDACSKSQTQRHRGTSPNREKAAFQLVSSNQRSLGPTLRKSWEFQSSSHFLHEFGTAMGLPHVHRQGKPEIYKICKRNKHLFQCIPITWNILRGSHYCFIYWNVVMWVCWFVANRKNPGYIPMNSESYHRSIKQIPMFDKWKKRNAILNRLCHTCRCLRPLRAKHCRICNRCVSYFDHHCPFIYNCVGLRNRTWFFLFVMSIAVNCSFTIYFAMYCIAIEGFGILYVLGLLEAFVFSGLGWILTCTSVRNFFY